MGAAAKKCIQFLINIHFTETISEVWRELLTGPQLDTAAVFYKIIICIYINYYERQLTTLAVNCGSIKQ